MKVYPMRRKDRQAGEEDILRILKENVYGVLSTISEAGPTASPSPTSTKTGKSTSTARRWDIKWTTLRTQRRHPSAS